jgi:hypothetical protein
VRGRKKHRGEESCERKKAEREKKTEVAKRKEEREIEKEKGGEIKYNCLKSREGIVIVKFETILFTLLSFLLK